MNIKIKFTNLDKSSAIEDYVSKKLASLSKFFKDGEESVLAEVELAKTTGHHKSGDIYKTEINITFMGRQFYVVAEKEDLYAAVDEARDEAEREIVSNKKKHTAVFRRGAGKIKKFIKKFSN
jgi:putative sigma-54 modulation protein